MTKDKNMKTKLNYLQECVAGQFHQIWLQNQMHCVQETHLGFAGGMAVEVGPAKK